MKDLLDTMRFLLSDVLKTIGIIETKNHLIFPSDLVNGDFCTNIALTQTKKRSEDSITLANKIKEEFEKRGLPNGISKIEVAGSGFVNFYFSKDFFIEQIKKINHEGFSFGKLSIHAGKKILVEHSSPNLFKTFHIGHAMNNTIGESIARLAEYSGAEVVKISYPSDVSLGIGKAIYVIMQDGISKLESFQTEEEKLSYLGECYVLGTKMFEENKELETKVRDITQKIYDKISSPELDVYEKCRKINLSYFVNIVARLGSVFDSYIFESEAGKEGEKIVREHIGDIFTESEGAIVYKGEKDGLHTRVFINKSGNPTYEAKDVGLLSLKFRRYSPDISIFITDNQQSRYFEVVVSAAGKIKSLWKEKTIHKTHGRMSFMGKKMSSRLGGVPNVSSLLDMIVEEVVSRTNNMDKKQIDMIAIASLKFDILRVMTGKNINFDPDAASSFEGDSGPYLQYTAVRAFSILRKARERGLINGNYDRHEDLFINDVLRILVHFPRIIEISILDWAPHYLAVYLIELSHAFNSWYANTKILDQNNPMLQFNLKLTNAVYIVIKNGLWVLGIEVPERM